MIPYLALAVALVALWIALRHPGVSLPAITLPDDMNISIQCPQVALWCF